MNNLCKICGSKKITRFLQRDSVPTHQNYILKSEEKAKNIKRGNLSLFICRSCGFIFNNEFDESKLDYGQSYDNTQDISPVFRGYIEKEIDFLINNFDMKDKTIIEVGCGKGAFLKELVKKADCYGIGFDPSYVGKDELQNGKVKFIKAFYDERFSDIKVDFIICRHVIEHIQEPLTILKSIKKTLRNSKDALIFFETPSVKWILENNIIYDFFYEHCSYFDKVSITKALNLSGFSVIKILKEFNSQYMWILAKSEENINLYKEMNEISEIDHLYKLAQHYSGIIRNHMEQFETKVIQLKTKGNIAVWGAGAKGVTILNLIDPSNQLIDSVIDINEKKQGCFIPGSAHEIISYKQIIERNISSIIVMNNNYYEEIQDLLAKSNINVNLVSGEGLV